MVPGGAVGVGLDRDVSGRGVRANTPCSRFW